MQTIKPKLMDAGGQNCPNQHCPLRGLKGQGNITIHCPKRGRYRCKFCRKTFSERTGTPFNGLKKEKALVVQVLTLLTYGCPIQAIVAAFELDERTVADWRDRAGLHCQQVHKALIGKANLDLQHVQADEIRAKARGKVVWLAMALMVSTRLWLGGVVSRDRDHHLAQDLMQLVAGCAKALSALLILTDGWPAYPKAVLTSFRTSQPRQKGHRGRSRLTIWPELCFAQVVKVKVAGRLVGVKRLLEHGTLGQARQLLQKSGGGQVLNTSYIERFNATLRQRLASLTRRSRQAADRLMTLHAGMYLIGTVYNFCWPHHSLRQFNAALTGAGAGPKWRLRTPAMASGLTDHVWSLEELLSYKIAPPPYVAPKKRGRPPKTKSSVVNELNHH
jgi:transposase-like protein/IS1 family transposase